MFFFIIALCALKISYSPTRRSSCHARKCDIYRNIHSDPPTLNFNKDKASLRIRSLHKTPSLRQVLPDFVWVPGAEMAYF